MVWCGQEKRNKLDRSIIYTVCGLRFTCRWRFAVLTRCCERTPVGDLLDGILLLLAPPPWDRLGAISGAPHTDGSERFVAAAGTQKSAGSTKSPVNALLNRSKGYF